MHDSPSNPAARLPFLGALALAAAVALAAGSRPSAAARAWRPDAPAQAAGAPLPSSNDGRTRRAILAFVERATREGGPEYLAPAARIAVFDNDETL